MTRAGCSDRQAGLTSVRIQRGTTSLRRYRSFTCGSTNGSSRPIAPVQDWSYGRAGRVKGFGRRPFATLGLRPGPALESLPRRKPRGGRGTVWRARLWGFEDRGRLTSEASAMGDARCFQRKRRWLEFSMATMRGSEALASVAGGLATSRGRRARVPARGRRRRRSTVRGGILGAGHEESILIRVGDGERQGRGPSNVSTMIIRPPQHGHRRKDDWLSVAVGVGGRAIGRDFGRGEQLADALDVVRANRAGEQAVVADAVEAARQHVQEKAADELAGVERHGLEPVAAFDAVILPLEGPALLVERDEPGVRDGDAMGVAGEIGENGLWPGERPLGVDHPFRAAQRGERGVEGGFVGERGKVAEEGEAAGRMQGREPFEEESAVFRRAKLTP